MAWKVKKLGEVCEIVKDKPPYFEGEKNYFSTGAIRNDKIDLPVKVNYQGRPSRANCYPRLGDIGFAKMKFTNKVLLINSDLDGSIFSTGFCFLRPKTNLDNKFLFHFIISDTFQELKNLYSGEGIMGGIKNSDVENIEIPVPPLPIQKKIVEILDSAFEKIAKAKENSEQNLKNAKEVFESYLQKVFGNKGENWDNKDLSCCFKLKSGDGLTSKNMIPDGKYPVYGGNGISGYFNSFNISENTVIIGRVGALCGNVRHIKNKIWLTDNAFKIVDYKIKFDNDFLTYLLNHKNLRSFARQTAQPVISNSSLSQVPLSFPKSLSEQKSIVSKLDNLSEQTKQLESIYSRKLSCLEELKQSILQKAFKGELTEVSS